MRESESILEKWKGIKTEPRENISMCKLFTKLSPLQKQVWHKVEFSARSLIFRCLIKLNSIGITICMVPQGLIITQPIFCALRLELPGSGWLPGAEPDNYSWPDTHTPEFLPTLG